MEQLKTIDDSPIIYIQVPEILSRNILSRFKSIEERNSFSIFSSTISYLDEKTLLISFNSNFVVFFQWTYRPFLKPNLETAEL